MNGKIYCGTSVRMKITLKDGSYREDIGYGTAESDVAATAIGNSRKIAVTDSLKRTMRLFGSRLGNCLGEKDYTTYLTDKDKSKRK